jgi:O-methyltransferase
MRPQDNTECLNAGDPRVARRVRHPLRELVQRARDPEWVVDTALRFVAYSWDRVSPSEFSSLYRRIRTRTMCSNARLRGLYHGVRTVVKNQIPGDFVECGTALGGSAALMALTLRQLGVRRKLWVFDTFEGLPAPTPEDPDFEVANLFAGTCIGTLEEVQSLFTQLQVRDQVQFVKGLFQDTLPTVDISQIALLHIDGDWYDSVKTCLDSLYDKVAPGGIIQFDDYGYGR